ncbi:MAG: polyphosphate kinase [Natronomonas sp.]|jgi:polyphosphate kinase
MAPDSDARSVDLSDPTYYLNRELSELAFQRRVLHEALDDRTPLLEQLRFLAIVTRNLDEFFMKRVGGLKQQVDAGITERTADGRTPEEQWQQALETARPLLERQASRYQEHVRPALAAAGIEVVDYDDLAVSERTTLREFFESSVLPTLTPLSFDPAHPFPFISNRSLSLAVLTRSGDDENPTFNRVKVPPNRPRFIPVGGDSDDRYVRVEEVIRDNLDLLFPGTTVVDAALFRLTRNAEVRRDEEVAEDLIEMVEEVLEERRFATVVRLELEAGAPQQVRRTLVDQLDLDRREVFELPAPLDFRDFETLVDLDYPELKPAAWTPQRHSRLPGGQQGPEEFGNDHDGDIFAAVERNDILLHHPYHSFTDTVQRFLDEAAHDPDVLAIKAAIYRTASDSQVIQSLIDAAENGKQVAVMVELKARFDEQNNLEWVRTLEEHGIHVAYGTVGLKTHTKTALVVRQESEGVELYSHVGTGNYHSGTAKGYVDLGLLTADQDIGHDLVKLFNSFTGPTLEEQFRELLVAPVTMRDQFTDLIRNEAAHARDGEHARLVVKTNSLEDPAVIRELYQAAMAGVDIDLVVRDICRLRPGIEGVSERVDVYSIVGRFLEHSRVFYFENGTAVDEDGTRADAGPRYYIGSADWMTRNLDRRVEAVTPVDDPALREQLRFILDLALADNRRVWEMDSDGSYTQRTPGDDRVVDTQAVLMAEAEAAADTEQVTRGIPCAFDLPDSGLRLGGDTGPDGSDEGAASASEPVAPGANGADGAAGDDTDGSLPAALRANPDRWYRPDSETYAFAVRTPDGGRVYRKTAGAAASLVEQYWG